MNGGAGGTHGARAATGGAAGARDVGQAAVRLLDERSRPSLRDVLGRMLARAESADFAVARIRLDGLDLSRDELGSVRRCRVLVGRIDAATLAEATPTGAGAASRLRELRALRDFLASGRLELRAAGAAVWTPDFSVLTGIRIDGTGAPRALAFVGAHYFARPHPAGGPAWTCAIGEARAIRAARARFEELWQVGYDVRPVIGAVLERSLATVAAPADEAGRR